MRTKINASIKYDDLRRGTGTKCGNYNAYSIDSATKTKKCPYCKNDYEYHATWVHYMVGKKQFCSWNCKCAYIRQQEKIKNEKEREIFWGKKSNKKLLVDLIKEKKRELNYGTDDLRKLMKMDYTSFKQLEQGDFSRATMSKMEKLASILEFNLEPYIKELEEIYGAKK